LKVSPKASLGSAIPEDAASAEAATPLPNWRRVMFVIVYIPSFTPQNAAKHQQKRFSRALREMASSN
jgi:hypothetical protein